MDDIRRRRVEGELRDLVAELIIGGQVKDPRVGPFVSVTRVEAARDLSVAKVYVSVFPDPALSPETPAETAGAEAKQESADARRAAKERDRLDLAVEGLQRAAGFIQSQLGKRMKTRLTPKLSFVADIGIQAGFELNERMKGLFP